MPSALSEPLFIVISIGLALFVVTMVILRMRRPAGSEPDPVLASENEAATGPLAAVVVNPSKFDDDGASVRKAVESACRRRGWRVPLWIETTAEDTGTGQARQALDQGVDLILACGGDGTVRQVAAVVAGTHVPLGLLPAGTGNLLARNVGIDVLNMEKAIETALAGDDVPVDVGYIRFDDDDPAIFLVMAGMGLDAQIMLSAPENLKSRVGPLAYVFSGARHLYGPRTKVDVAVDDEPLRRRRIRALIVGNCGKLVGGLVLMPDARIDDGLLDAVTIAPQGVVGWGNVATAVLTRDRRGHRTFERFRGSRISAVAEDPLPAEIDGDPVGYAGSFETWVDHKALVVRGPGARAK